MSAPGERSIDEAYDFSRARRLYARELAYYINFLQQEKKDAQPVPIPYHLYLKTPTTCQRSAMVQAKHLIADLEKGSRGICHIRGAGGVGKSQLIYSVAALLTQKGIEFAIVCPTGCAAAAYGAETIHSYLNIRNCKQDYKSMIQEHVSPALRKKICALKILIIDEAFLMNSRCFAMVLKRIAFIKNITDDLPISILATFDEKQLSLPGASNLFTTPDPNIHDDMTLYGLNMFIPKYSFVMRTNVRQAKDPIYSGILQRLHDDETTPEDIKLISTRLVDRVPPLELKAFWTSIHLFKNNSSVDLWNRYFLSKSAWSLRKVKPVSTPLCLTCELAFPHSWLGKGVPVYLTRNLLVSRRLCNGTCAQVVDVFYSENSDKFPAFITISCASYSGKCLAEDSSIPIPPVTESVLCPHLNKRIKITYFPICNSHARTFFKIQSLSLDSIAVDLDGISLNDKASVYTAFSRCRTLDGLLIHSTRPLEDFFKK